VDATTVVLVTASEVFYYALAFFFVVVAVALAYALFRVGNVLGRADKMLEDIDREAVPLLRKSGETLDGVNGSLQNVDEITRDVADMTDKVNGLVTAVDSALQTPAKKAAAFGSGVQQAVSSFLRRDQSAGAGAETATASAGAAPGWEASPAWEAPPASPASEPAAAPVSADEPATAGDEPVTAVDEPVVADEPVAADELEEGSPS
jgi:uncharacterized protein YoxC